MPSNIKTDSPNSDIRYSSSFFLQVHDDVNSLFDGADYLCAGTILGSRNRKFSATNATKLKFLPSLCESKQVI